MTNAADVVVWSADVKESVLDGWSLRDDMPLRYIKLARPELRRMGDRKIKQLQDRGFQVFADTKLIGVPREIMEMAEEFYFPLRPWMLGVMAGGSSTGLLEHEDVTKVEALKRFADACRKVGTKSCGVTLLTSKSEEMALLEFGRTSTAQVLVYAEMLVNAGFTDIVCSPLEAARLRQDSFFDSLTINTPGIRLLGTDVRDQSRIETPAGAIAAGADRLIIGSNLTDGNLIENFNRIAENLNGK